MGIFYGGQSELSVRCVAQNIGEAGKGFSYSLYGVRGFCFNVDFPIQNCSYDFDCVNFCRSNSPSPLFNNRTKIIIISVISGLLVIAFVAIFVYIFLLVRKRKRNEKKDGYSRLKFDQDNPNVQLNKFNTEIIYTVDDESEFEEKNKDHFF